MNLALNPGNGHLLLPSHRFLTPGLHPGAVETLGPTYPPARRAMGTGWEWYDLRFELLPMRFGLSLGFYGTSLRTCLFGLPTTQPAPGWATWNEAHEQQLAEVYDTWLTEQVGPNRTFAWGLAWAEYDPRSGCSSLGIRYTGA